MNIQIFVANAATNPVQRDDVSQIKILGSLPNLRLKEVKKTYRPIILMSARRLNIPCTRDSFKLREKQYKFPNGLIQNV